MAQRMKMKRRKKEEDERKTQGKRKEENKGFGPFYSPGERKSRIAVLFPNGLCVSQ